MKKLKPLIKYAVTLLIVSQLIANMGTSLIKQDLQWQLQHQKYYDERITNE